ncbi:cellulose synthase (UDP-forming) [Paraburkholderia bannensis]|uniref:Cellulose synthase catalytic subunit [UDP-forming] n=1 Tax=Paraburkholderia bannensis TaxID=765414 RepID=A0A7W9WTB3_9BURK|nr:MULTISPECIES: UDP-forming cellulose synthase catalytic subunit [Paraburkholderia]MBB3258154.1 cellulose synthase (UDP-forming) [Paraburkholderia sp. WP4_3_2]MBB6103167.1 cellulose synthase (UDP-forming) [Paraburkholderia bannensis]
MAFMKRKPTSPKQGPAQAAQVAQSQPAGSGQTDDAGDWDDTLLNTGTALLAPAWARLSVTLAAAALFVSTLTVHLALSQQWLFAILCMAVALLLSRLQGRVLTVSLVALSVFMSMRYLYWRVTQTLDFTTPLDRVFGYLLLAAEGYAVLMLLCSYFQTLWPLHRRPVPLPADTSAWPTVDVFIPTYNEPLEVVRQSVLAATLLDWPADKLRVYLLDDGRRPEFHQFCEQAGVEYLTRPDNKHAKAGNLNAALAKTHGEFVAVFDCDHVTTRSFLQICMGWFLKDPKMAMVQTPHVFYSPDPFERNLETFRKVPNEGDLFYGVLQNGNDLWNAAFFCGSCAVLRRSALEEVGGVATESVTEDALTALKMSMKGYNTAYLAIPQAAGLATESLGRHVGQRIRWARGMAEIFRQFNPLLIKGLSLPQRLCYLSAMMHFFFGLPRLVFLITPMAYLFFGAHVFHASALMVLAYAVPHLVISSIGASRIQGRFRHSFWSEVYETVLAWYVVVPALQAVFFPGSKGFNVTSKGGVIRKSFLDWAMARPYIGLLIINLTGFVVGIVGLIRSPGWPEAMSIVFNLVWVIYNVMNLSAAAGVATESRQLRLTPRVQIKLPAAVRLANGRHIDCQTSDYSQGGLGLVLPDDAPLPQRGERILVSVFRDDYEGKFPAEVQVVRGRNVGVSFPALTIDQERDLMRVTFSRADSWIASWGRYRPDRPLRSLLEVLGVGLRGLKDLFRFVLLGGSERLNRVAQTAASKMGSKQS